MEKGVLQLDKVFTEMAATIQNANIPTALQSGCPPMECVTPVDQPSDSVSRIIAV